MIQSGRAWPPVRVLKPLNFAIMKYFKVPDDLGGKSIGRGWYFVAGELWTEKELQRRGVDPGRLLPVSIPKNKVYFLFGARFAS